MSTDQRVKIAYSPLVADRICQHILEGKSVRQIEKMPGMPAARSVYRWLETNVEFRTSYQLARELWAHGFADEVKDLVDGKIIPWPEDQAQQKAWLKRVKLMVQARWWIYHRLAPKKYLFLGADSHSRAPYEVTEDIGYEVVEPLRLG